MSWIAPSGQQYVSHLETKIYSHLTFVQVRPCQDWLPHRREYLDEMHRHDGLGVSGRPLTCPDCAMQEGVIKCLDCLSGPLKCVQCTMRCHKHLPLHRLQRWQGTYFADESLQNIGLEVQVGHEDTDCNNPIPKSITFEVVDMSGQHTVTLSFCGCPGAAHPRVQLLRIGWFPASVDRPNTAFTFDMLNTFQLLNLQGKLSAYDFYHSLLHKTDNMGIQRRGDGSSSSMGDRYGQLLPVIRIWRHLKMLKRSGRGHDPMGIESTVDGECAVECPACPHPGKNLPSDWRDSPDTIRWIYALILTTDANFKLSLKEKDIQSDPALGDGWAHWVPRQPFYEYLLEHGGAVEVNYCDSDLKAINTAARNSKNYRASGAGACLCGRHGLLRKNGLGSLQIGERYPNMDYIVFCGLVRCILLTLWFSYDIVCQWSRNLVRRVETLPLHMQVDPNILNEAKKTLPKFHEFNHGYNCQAEYSLNITRHAGRMNGEDPERWWSYVNPASMSTKEMGEGSREDTLDDFARSYNFRKIAGFGTFYPPKLDEAVEMHAIHQDAFEKFNETFPEEITHKWADEVTAWDADHTQPNPYVEPNQATSLPALKLELAQEEAADAMRGIFRTQDKSIAAFLSNALDLEEEQRLIILKTKSKATDLQASARQEKSNTLHMRIARFREMQVVYMPGVAPLTPTAYDIQQPTASDSSHLPELECLWLPSAIPRDMRDQACVPGLVKTETRFQLALLDDTLVNLRRLLRISATVREHTRSNGAGTSQRLGSRSQNVLHRFTDKIARCVARYRAAYAALMSFDPTGDWKDRLQELKPDDVRSPHRDHRKHNDTTRPSEGKRELSWIWLRNGPLGRPTMENLTPEQITDDMRAEWARMQARADRWSEEGIWLVEEMRRILSYFEWKANWWCRQHDRRTDASPDAMRGLNAYADKQAALVTALGHSFAQKWYPFHLKHNISVEWPVEFIPIA
ncbi:hypothetical protein FIBSPDRAFT_728847 [Athelia psychrophila]|uniref:CxC2-like cysteine cluster KDZ transposase-associated domain-containing protein n=1 Tax=Athelia psychrophila TaxID=1759441 RepID=A0A166RUU2_9AGAM|nr:hypothetical protein FIBSPDRAFT_728847 [Fibularhizoctonia sp. CBS 109695]